MRLVTETWLAPAAAIVLQIVAMLFGTPLEAAPDSPLHALTAWYDVHHWFPTTLQNVFQNGRTPVPCFAFKPLLSASCANGHVTVLPWAAHHIPYNYPPLAYWLAGGGELLGKPFGAVGALWGARLALTIACCVVLCLAVRRLYVNGLRTAAWAIVALLVPTASFILASINPNGLEIALAVLFATLLVTENPSVATRLFSPGLAVTGVALALTRPTGFLWLAILVALLIARSLLARTSPPWRVVITAVPGFLVGATWAIFNPSRFAFPGLKVQHVTLSVRLHNLNGALHHLPSVLREAFSVLGWLDTMPPRPIAYGGILLFLFGALLVLRQWRDVLFYVGGWLVAAASTAVLEAWNWASWPAWWQGRYTLPVLLGLGVLSFSRLEGAVRRTALGWASLSLALNAVITYLATARFSIGLTTTGWPGTGVSAYTPTHRAITTALEAAEFLLALILMAVAMVRADA